MSEHSPYSKEQSDQEKNRILQYTVELERELMKMRRTEKVLHEMEQRYLTLMDSGVFLYIVLASGGAFRMMNRRAEEFFGFQLKLGMEITLQSLSGPGYTGEVETMLKDTLEKSTHATLPVVRADGSLGWLDMEFFYSVYQGDPAIQIIASEITDLMKGKTEDFLPGPALAESAKPSPFALQILNGCPGLLCFAVDRNGTLVYSTRGYREVAKRFLDHECTPGFPYPVNLDTPFDMELQDLIQEAFLGNTSMTTLVEKAEEGLNQWNVTAAPMFSSPGEIAGAIVHLTSMPQIVQEPLPRAEHDVSDEIAVPSVFSQLDFLNTVPRMFFVVDDAGCCLEANDHFLNTLKLSREGIAGCPFADLALLGDPVNERLSERLILAIRNGFSEDLECRICSRDGEILSLGLKGTRLQWGAENATLVTCTDNTKLRRTEEQLKRMSTTDASTGIMNRQGMERVLNTEIERAARYRGSLALIMLDVDGFRHLNEQIGYAASDRILRELATAFKSRIRLTDFLGRWGGDEFMILTPLPLTTASQLAEKLRDMVQHKTFGENSSLTLSAGVAEFAKSMDVPDFVASAYDAMTEAKRGGGNRIVQARLPESQDLPEEPFQEKQEKTDAYETAE